MGEHAGGAAGTAAGAAGALIDDLHEALRSTADWRTAEMLHNLSIFMLQWQDRLVHIALSQQTRSVCF